MKNLFLLCFLIFSSIASGESEKIINEISGKYKENQGTKNPDSFLVNKIQTDRKVDFIKVLKHNFNETQKKRLNKFLPVMNKTLSSVCFEDFWNNRELIQTNGKTNQEVLEHIKNSTVGVELVSYFKLGSTVGYTYPNTNKIWLNEKMHRNFDSCRSASNMAHEGSHKIGYGHDYYKTANRNKSVPYSINAGFSKCCYVVNEIKEKVKSCYRSWKTLWLVRYCN